MSGISYLNFKGLIGMSFSVLISNVDEDQMKFLYFQNTQLFDLFLQLFHLFEVFVKGVAFVAVLYFLAELSNFFSKSLR